MQNGKETTEHHKHPSTGQPTTQLKVELLTLRIIPSAAVV
jgi:hypothetical protein